MRRVPGSDLGVEWVDPASLDPHQNLTFARNWTWEFAQLERGVIGFENERPHRRRCRHDLSSLLAFLSVVTSCALPNLTARQPFCRTEIGFAKVIVRAHLTNVLLRFPPPFARVMFNL